MAPLSDKTYRRIAREHQTYLLEDLWEEFRGRAGAIDISLLESETTQGAIERLKQEAVKKVRDGAELLVLTDRTAYDGERRYLDPHLAVSATDQALKQFRLEPGRGQPAAPLRDRPALGRNPQRPRRDAGAGARGERRLPLRDVRGDLRRGLRGRRRQPMRGALEGDREGDLDDRHPRGARLRPAVLLDRHQAGACRDLPDRGLRRLRSGRRRVRRPRRRHQRALQDARSRGGVQAGEDLPLLPQGLQGGGRDRQRLRLLRRVLPEGPRPGGAEPDLDAPRDGAALRSRADQPRGGRRRDRPPRLPDRDQLDELRIAVRARLPLLRGGREADQHPLHQRRGRRDPRHVRALPQVAWPAGRLGALRGLGRDAELLLRRRDQDRPRG